MTNGRLSSNWSGIAAQFPCISLFSAETTGTIFIKILHDIVALVVIINHAFTMNARATSEGGRFKRLTKCWDIPSDMPFLPSHPKRCSYPRNLWGYWTKCHQNCKQCTEIHSTEIGIAILQFILKWQHDKGDWSVKNTDFSTLIGCHRNVPWGIKKRSRSVIFKQIPIIWCKDRKNRSSGSWDNLSLFKKSKKLWKVKYIARSAN